jgi:hypothetical protein
VKGTAISHYVNTRNERYPAVMITPYYNTDVSKKAGKYIAGDILTVSANA